MKTHDGRCVIFCRACRIWVYCLSRAERDDWADQHQWDTGHDDWLLNDGWPDPYELEQLAPRD